MAPDKGSTHKAAFCFTPQTHAHCPSIAYWITTNHSIKVTWSSKHRFFFLFFQKPCHWTTDNARYVVVRGKLANTMFTGNSFRHLGMTGVASGTATHIVHVKGSVCRIRWQLAVRLQIATKWIPTPPHLPPPPPLPFQRRRRSYGGLYWPVRYQ